MLSHRLQLLPNIIVGLILAQFFLLVARSDRCINSLHVNHKDTGVGI